jgi:hypothetical protein
VIPVKFGLAAATKTTTGPTVLTSDSTDLYSFLSFTPSSTLNFGDITTLKADYSVQTGNCHLGALRWSIRVSSTQSVFVYYGDYPNFTDCTGGNSQSTVNLTSLSDLRDDTSQVGGTFYDTWAHAVTLVGTMPIVRASLVADGLNQSFLINSATVNDNTYTGSSSVSTPFASTCTLPPANLVVNQTSGAFSGLINENSVGAAADSGTAFRNVDCKYMYNLATSSLHGTGTYRVEVSLDGGTTTIPDPASFQLK